MSPVARRVILTLGIATVTFGVIVTAYAVSQTGDRPDQSAAAGPSPASPSPTPTPIPTFIPSPTPTAAPTAPSPSLGVQITVSQYGSVEAFTQAGASCSLSATYSNGSPVSGITNPQRADGSGHLQWTYPQLANPPGLPGSPGTHTVTCTLNGLSGSDSRSFYTRPQI
jgi:hypothetical protein